MFIVSDQASLDALIMLHTPPAGIFLYDHLGGFDADYKNPLVTAIDQYAETRGQNLLVKYHQFLPQQVHANYPNLKFKFELSDFAIKNFKSFANYENSPAQRYEHFICSFNGIGHVSRQLLVAALHQRGWFNTAAASKNFTFSSEMIDGHIQSYVGDRDRFYRKFFIKADSEQFFQTVSGFGHERNRHDQNVHTLENILTSSFLNIVSESVATSSVPYITEKSLYSVVTKGLFLAYAQPGWHSCLEQQYGLKPYHNLFDYRFDSITNPVVRLIELLGMVSKFEKLSAADKHDLYQLEKDTIEYNYHYYFSGKMLTTLLGQYG
jgi:hypothetical protein